MPKRALVEHRPWLLLGIAAAIAFYLLDGSGTHLGEVWIILIKGAGVGALAIYAAHRATGVDAWHIAAVLGTCALADMALELWFEIGAAIFALAHILAIALYLRFPRHHSTFSQKALSASLLVGTPLLAWLLSQDLLATAYALMLGGMAATAWMSRFSRYRVGLGAVLFVASDLLIFSQLGATGPALLPELAIWPLYFIGQFLIATGVVQTLRHELAEEDN